MSYIVQFAEKNFSSRDIAELSGDQLLVHSNWYSIQGEGPYAGYPAVFIRLAGCNRGAKTDACAFCDTNFLVSGSKLHTVEDLVDTALSYPYHLEDKPLVVITGGEPFLHPKLPDLVTGLSEAGFIVQIESNGDFVRSDSALEAVIVVSPKLSSRLGKYSKPPQGMLERADCLKVLVSADPESPYHNLPEYVHDFALVKGGRSVFISPINEYLRGVEPGEVASMWGNLYDPIKCSVNHQYAAKVAMDNCFRLSLQLHAFVAVP